MSRPHADTRLIFNRVTDAIIGDLERGVRSWSKPWSTGAAGAIDRPLRHSGDPYHGINVVLLWSEAAAKGFNSPPG